MKLCRGLRLVNSEADRDVKLGAGVPAAGVPVVGDAHAISRVATPDRSGPPAAAAAAVSGALDTVQKAVSKDRVLYALPLTPTFCPPDS